MQLRVFISFSHFEKLSRDYGVFCITHFVESSPKMGKCGPENLQISISLMQSQLKQDLYQKSDMYLYLDFVPNEVSKFGNLVFFTSNGKTEYTSSVTLIPTN